MLCFSRIMASPSMAFRAIKQNGSMRAGEMFTRDKLCHKRHLTVINVNSVRLRTYRTNRKIRRNFSCRFFSSSRHQNARHESFSEKNKTLALYALSAVVGVLGGSYAAVPLYKIFCQATGFGGTTQKVDVERAKTLTPVENGRVLKITFNADTSDVMPWKFRPSQKEVKIVPGETALAFFKAVNKSDKPITGVATYNVTPMRAGIYFNKIQCFCFEEQRLGPKEEVDMPVFFYVDPEFLDDPLMDGIKTLTLSYTFFKTDHEDEEEREAGNNAMV